MIKKIGFLAAGLMASYAAAITSVWDATDGNGEVPPIGKWYTYANDKTDAADLKDGTKGEKILTATVSKTSESSAAGMGFALAKEKTTIDLSAYEGVCLTYSATKAFKFDIKQSTISDYNYNGIVVEAKTALDTLFIPFSKLAQEEWGDAVEFDPTKVEGMQFSYKQSIAKDAGVVKNVVTISSISLGSSCSNHAPEVAGGHTATETADLAEGDTLKLDLGTLFIDADGDELTYAVTLPTSGEVVDLSGAKTYDSKSVILLATKPNPTDGATAVVKVTATDPAKKSATYTLTLTLEDKVNAPVARDFAFTVLEDSSYKNGLTNRLTSYGSDADGDAIVLELVDEPAHGTLDLDVATGIFTYTPAKDFYGTDSFTYQFVEKENSESVSNVGTAKITVTNVNDAPVVKVAAGAVYVDEAGTEHTFGDTLTVNEDFASFVVTVDKSLITITDADGDDDYKVTAKGSAVVNATAEADDDNYLVEVSAKKDSNGTAKVTLDVADPKVTVPTTLFYVVVKPVADPPVANADTYTIPSDSVFTVDAKKGVLANDVNPDGASVLKPIVVIEPDNGTVKVDSLGGFVYTSAKGYIGEDAFAYKVVNAAGDTSDMAIVTINVVKRNMGPTVVEGVADTVGNRLAELTEDFATAKKFTKAELESWFEDDSDPVSKLKFSVRTDDSLTKPSIANGVISVAAVKDACGDATVIVVATDTEGATGELAIPVSIKCVNDKPAILKAIDTIRVAESGWDSVNVDMSKIISDPDGDTLKYTVTDNVSFKRDFSFTAVDNIVTIKPLADGVFNAGTAYNLAIKAADPAGLSASAKIYIIIGEAKADTSKADSSDSDSTKAIKHFAAGPKASWQSAILAKQGSAVMMDMQGRVMWIRRLPVSAAEVRAAAAEVQGRKILKVNSQTYTIK